MVRRVTADKWEIISRDDTGAMVNIDYVCPHCHFPTGNFILIGEQNVAKLDEPWETDQTCEVCGNDVIIECLY